MQRSHRDHLAAASTVAALTALVVVTVLVPRLAQLRTATTSAGGATLVIVGLLISLAALAPLAALVRVQTWKPVAVSIIALALGSVLVLSFNERDGSDGLFMLPLLIGSVIIVGMSGLVTLRLRRPAS